MSEKSNIRREGLYKVMDNNFRIIFEKPNFTELNRQYTVVDMHFHSKCSDGKNTVKEIASHARKLGIGIAVTDHNVIKTAVEIDKHKDVFSIPGIEITSKEGTHILVYFYDIESLERFYNFDVKPYKGSEVTSSTSLNMEEIVRRARAFDALIIFPHPYCAAYTGIKNQFFSETRLLQLYDAVDGVEVINAGNLKRWNLKSTVLGFNLDKAMTGGSDGHTVKQMGRALTCAECKKDRKEFLDTIKKKQNIVIGKEFDMFRKVASNGFKLKTSLKNYPDLVEKNIKYSYTVINSKSKSLRDNVKRKINEKIRNHMM